MTHLTGFTWFSARRGRRGGAGHHEMIATIPACARTG